MRTHWFRKVLQGLSFTSVLFIFQACYGTPQDMRRDFLIEGQVMSKATSLPIQGIKVSILNAEQYQFTGTDGKFLFYTLTLPTYQINFDDADGSQNGSFQTKDTIISNINAQVSLNILLETR
jgi:putative lipoprotein (rSAM/lipoprotein system)